MQKVFFAKSVARDEKDKRYYYMRKLIADGNEAYIIAGMYGIGGIGDKGEVNILADGKLTVPGALWKVIVVLPVGSDDLSRINRYAGAAQTRVIAVWTVGRCHSQYQRLWGKSLEQLPG